MSDKTEMWGALHDAAEQVPPGSEGAIDCGFAHVRFGDISDNMVERIRQWVENPDSVAFGTTDEMRAAVPKGPSYIAWGGWVGDQQTAILLMALGAREGWWSIAHPGTLGFDRDSAEAREMMGSGFVMTTGIPGQGASDEG